MPDVSQDLEQLGITGDAGFRCGDRQLEQSAPVSQFGDTLETATGAKVKAKDWKEQRWR